ncbi:hypothetical protein XENOCAPTIV_029497, partial [Xenoophorus captivus]
WVNRQLVKLPTNLSEEGQFSRGKMKVEWQRPIEFPAPVHTVPLKDHLEEGRVGEFHLHLCRAHHNVR